MERPLSGMKNRDLKGFGPFQVELADHLNYNTSLRLATLWEYPRSFIGSLQSENADVGLMMVDKMVERGDITSDDISTLTNALRQCKLDGVATEVEKIFRENTSQTDLTKPETNIQRRDEQKAMRQWEEHGNALSTLLQATEDLGRKLELPTPTGSRTDTLAERHRERKEVEQELLHLRSSSLEAIDTAEAFIHENSTYLSAQQHSETRRRIRELRKQLEDLTDQLLKLRAATPPQVEAVQPIDLNCVTIEATDSKEKHQSIIDQLKEASDRGSPIPILILHTTFATIHENGNINLSSGLILPFISTVAVLAVWTEKGRVLSEAEFSGLLKYGSKSTRIQEYKFQHCDLPPLTGTSSREVLKELQERGAKVTWDDTGHCLNASHGSWEMNTIDRVRADCGAGVAMNKQWRKETLHLQIKMLGFATEKEIPIRLVNLNRCYSSITSDGSNIILQSGQSLPAMSSVKIINITTEDGRLIPEDEFARLLDYANQSQAIEDLRFQECELPPTVLASTISSEMKSKNFKVSWLDTGHRLNLHDRTWGIDDMETIREICGLGVPIYKQCSSHMHTLQMHLLTVASQNNIPITLISLRDSYRAVDATTGSIILESGVMLPRLSSLCKLAIDASGRELTEEDVNGLMNYSRQCSELDLFWCSRPKNLPVSLLQDPLISGKLKVLWYPDGPNKQCYTLDPASGRWVE